MVKWFIGLLVGVGVECEITMTTTWSHRISDEPKIGTCHPELVSGYFYVRYTLR